jgi:uncharacterized protein
VRFEWDEANVEHITRHGYHPDEVEESFAAPHHVRRARLGRYAAYGTTMEGRYTLVIFKRLVARAIRVVTARDMSRAERRLFRRLTGE